MSATVKYLLDETRIPKDWYNIVADLPRPPDPALHPGTLQPIGPDDLAPMFPTELILQEVTTEREIAIPEPVREIYRQWRPSPLFRARRLEAALDTPARIYYKYEGVSAAGSHKLNTAVAQAFYNREAGITRLTTETGAGQWGSSLAYAGALFGLEVRVFMVRASFNQKPYRKAMMEPGVRPASPAPASRPPPDARVLAEHPDTSRQPRHRHQRGGRDRGAERRHQLRARLRAEPRAAAPDGDRPGGDRAVRAWPTTTRTSSSAAPAAARISPAWCSRSSASSCAAAKVRAIACEPAACPTLTRGQFAYDFGDTGHLTPLVRMHTLGSAFIPPGFHAGGLRYHGMAPLVSLVQELGLIEARAFNQTPCFEAGVQFARAEGIVPAPEANHAIRAVIDEALRCKEEGVARTIVFNLSGHGHFDMQAYIDYFAGKLEDRGYDNDALQAALAELPRVPA